MIEVTSGSPELYNQEIGDPTQVAKDRAGRMMLCPHCDGVLKQLDHFTLVLDYCSDGHGIWFDPDELKNFLDLHRAIKTHDAEIALPVTETEQKLKALGEFKCPHRHAPLMPRRYLPDHYEFVYDACQVCHGIWVEREDMPAVSRIMRSEPLHLSANRALLPAQMYRVRRDIELDEMRDASKSAARFRFGPIIPIPYKDIATGEHTRPVINYILMAVIAFMGVLSISSGAEVVRDLAEHLGFVPTLFVAGEWWRLFTPVLVHGGLAHLLGNMYFLYIFGDNIEYALGKMYAAFFLLAAAGSSLFYFLFHIGSAMPAIGASGAISGIMGAYLIFFPRNRIKVIWFTFRTSLSAEGYLIIWFVWQFISMLLHEGGGPGIAFSAHVGGFLVGVLWALMMKPRVRLRAKKKMSEEVIAIYDAINRPYQESDFI